MGCGPSSLMRRVQGTDGLQCVTDDSQPQSSKPGSEYGAWDAAAAGLPACLEDVVGCAADSAAAAALFNLPLAGEVSINESDTSLLSWTMLLPCIAASMHSTQGVGEQERLAAVARLRARPPTERLRKLTGLLRDAFDAPLAYISLLDQEEVWDNAVAPDQWQPSRRCDSVCEWVLRQDKPEVMVVEDFSADARFRSLPAVAAPPHARFYASAPLLASGHSGGTPLVYGTLCVLDHQPRTFPASQYQMLAHFARLAVGELERDLGGPHGAAAAAGTAAKEAVIVCQTATDGWPIVYGNPAAADLLGLQQFLPDQAASFWQLFSPASPSTHNGDLNHNLGGSHNLEDNLGRSRQQQQQLALQLRWLVARGKPFTFTCRGSVRSAARRRGLCCSSSFDGSLGGPSLGTYGTGTQTGLLLLTADDRDRRRRASSEAALDRIFAAASGARESEASRDPSGICQAGLAATGGASSVQLAVPAGCSCPAASQQEVEVTFTPCSWPHYFAGTEPPIGIPVTSGDHQGSSSSTPHLVSSGRDGATAAALNNGGGSHPQPSPNPQPLEYCFATLRVRSRTADADRCSPLDWGGLRAEGKEGAHTGCGTKPDPCPSLVPSPPEGINLELGPLLGVGACSRTYRGEWQGASVAVKVVEGREAPNTDSPGSGSGSGSGISSSNGGGSGGVSDHSMCSVEGVLSKGLRHPHLVPTLAFGTQELGSGSRGRKEHWIVQELCNRGTLAKAVESGALSDASTGSPRFSGVLQTASEVAAALAYLHSNGVLHGDLNGNNILLNNSTKDKRGFVAMVADFGLSQPLDVLSTLTTGTYGTVSHMPPELIIDGRLTTAADVYSFGVVLWEMLSGRRAWAGLNALQIINAVTVESRELEVEKSWPPALQDLVGRCLNADPKERPTADQLLTEVESMLALVF